MSWEGGDELVARRELGDANGRFRILFELLGLGICELVGRRAYTEDRHSVIVLPDTVRPCVGHEPVINRFREREREKNKGLARFLGSIACE